MPSCCHAFSERNLLMPFYHIPAVKMSIGQHSEGKRQINFSQLRKNVRPRSQKRSGRKRPRPGNCDVTAAPDAATKLKEPKLATDDSVYTNFITRLPKKDC